MTTQPTDHEMLEHMKSVYKCVKYICDTHPSCKGDYRQLCWRVWKEYGINISFDTFKRIRYAPAPETICRRYRELSNAEPYTYKPLERTRIKRANREEIIRSIYGNGQKTLRRFQS